MSDRRRDEDFRDEDFIAPGDVIEGQFRVSTDPPTQPLARQVEEHVVIVEKRVPVPVRVEVPVERIVYRERPVMVLPPSESVPPRRARRAQAEGDPVVGVVVGLLAMLLMAMMASCGIH